MPTLLRRSATPTAFTKFASPRCPVCASQLLLDDDGMWCRACLWCGKCHGQGCLFCPQPDVEDIPGAPQGWRVPQQACETCQRSVRAGQWPQCLDCLYYHVPPAEIVPLVGATSQVIRTKRVRWLRLHPGWGLVPAGEWIMRAPGTKREPMGKQLLGVRYVVERGHTSVI